MSKKDLREWLSYEKKRYKIGNSFLSFICAVLFLSEKSVLWRVQKRLRITEYHKNCGHRLRYKISLSMYHRLSFKIGIKIPPNTCGKGLHIVHLGSVLVNSGARIGENVSFHINTSVVDGQNGKNAVIGRGTILFVGATVLKGATVAENVMIGAGAVVTHDITEDGACVAGVPAKIISKRK